METATGVNVTEIRIYIYGKFLSTPSNDATCDINIGGWEGNEALSFTTTAAWQIITFDGLAGSQADLNALQVKITAPSVIAFGEALQVYMIYAEVHFTGASATSLE